MTSNRYHVETQISNHFTKRLLINWVMVLSNISRILTLTQTTKKMIQHHTAVLRESTFVSLLLLISIWYLVWNFTRSIECRAQFKGLIENVKNEILWKSAVSDYSSKETCRSCFSKTTLSKCKLMLYLQWETEIRAHFQDTENGRFTKDYEQPVMMAKVYRLPRLPFAEKVDWRTFVLSWTSSVGRKKRSLVDSVSTALRFIIVGKIVTIQWITIQNFRSSPPSHCLLSSSTTRKDSWASRHQLQLHFTRTIWQIAKTCDLLESDVEEPYKRENIRK